MVIMMVRLFSLVKIVLNMKGMMVIRTDRIFIRYVRMLVVIDSKS